jgi:hypothetical protein
VGVAGDLQENRGLNGKSREMFLLHCFYTLLIRNFKKDDSGQTLFLFSVLGGYAKISQELIVGISSTVSNWLGNIVALKSN